MPGKRISACLSFRRITLTLQLDDFFHRNLAGGQSNE